MASSADTPAVAAMMVSAPDQPNRSISAWDSGENTNCPNEAPAVMIPLTRRSEEHTSELQSLMRTSYAAFCLKKKNNTNNSLQTTNYNKHINTTTKDHSTLYQQQY